MPSAWPIGLVTSREETDVTSHQVKLPSFLEADDEVFIMWSGSSTVTFPGDWNVEVNETQDFFRGVFAWIRVVGDEGWEGTGNEITVTTGVASKSTHVTCATRGGHTATAPAFAFAKGTDTTPNPPSLNPANWDVEDTLWLVFVGYSAAGAVTVYPSGYGMQVFRQNAIGLGPGVAVCALPSAVASVDPGTFTVGNSHWVAVTVGIRPDPDNVTPTRGDFPVVAGVVGSFAATESDPHTINLPDNLEVGDIIYVWTVNDGFNLDYLADLNYVFGLALAGEIFLTCAWKQIDGSEGWGDTGNSFSADFPANEQSASVVVRVSGADLLIAHSLLYADAATTPNPPSIDPPFWGTEDVTWLVLAGWDNGTRSVSAYPSGFSSNQNESRTNTGAGTGVAVASKQEAASSQDPGTFTISENAWVYAATVGFLPAAIVPEVPYSRSIDINFGEHKVSVLETP